MCTVVQRFYNKKIKKLFCVHTTLIILLISLLYFLFLFFHFISVSVSHFLYSFIFFLFSFLKTLFLLKIFTQILFFFFSNFLCFFSIFSLLCECLFFCRVGVVMVGHRHHSHVVGIVSHWFWVMPWVWWVINFGSCHEYGLPWVLFLWLWVDFFG